MASALSQHWIIANIGQYLNQFASATRRHVIERRNKIEAYREKRRRSRATNSAGSNASEEQSQDSSVELLSLGLLIVFLFYVCLGAFLLPLLNGEARFIFLIKFTRFLEESKQYYSLLIGNPTLLL
uniref:G_PROTEIN_RECEP_F1_2 domain-containing protein n=1 Tax=Meloidogyne hapla TaxID=6305 RepID=A0A1I8BH77_MELHA